MPRIIHFDVIAKDVRRAIGFYEKVFGWNIEKWDGPMEYWLISTGPQSEPGIDGGLSQGEPNLTSGQLTLDVPSVDDAAALIRKNGGTITREKQPVPGVGWIVMFTDTEGNEFGLMEADPRAAV